MKMLLDDALVSIGGMGKYQLFLVVCIMVMLGWPSPAVIIVFTAIEMRHWCKLPGNATLDDMAMWIPWNNETGDYDMCTRYGVSASGEANLSVVETCTEWSYDMDAYGPSIVSTYDLVCDRVWWLSVVRTAFLAGMLVGAVYSGFVSDRFGRKFTFFGAALLCLGAWILGIFAPNITVYAFSRFLVGCVRLTVYSSGTFLGMELLGPKWRFAFGVAMNISFILGYMALAGLAFVIKNSFILELSIVCTSVPFLFLVFIIPESPRWLLAVGRRSEALMLIRKIGIRNGKPLPQSVTSFFVLKGDRNRRGNICDILRSKVLRRRFFIMSLNWMTVTLLYYTLTLNSQTLIPGNFYLNNFLLAFFELPGAFIGLGLSSWSLTGRRITTVLAYVFLTLANFATVTCSVYGSTIGVTAFVLSSKIFVTMAFSTIYPYNGELFPTEVRHVAFGLSNTFGRICALFSAYLGSALAAAWMPLPYIVFGVMGTVAGLLDLLLPETLNRNLSETVEEEEMKAIRKNTDLADLDDLALEASKVLSQEFNVAESDVKACALHQHPRGNVYY